ncbi:MAG: zf-HC2 domain-containing protein [Acidobacteriota bacterium]
MKCIDEKIYSAYLDEEVNEKMREAISSHLESCPRCRALVEGLKRENLMMREAFQIPLPEIQLVEELKERIQAMETPVIINGKRFSTTLYSLLILSGMIVPLLAVHLFSGSVEDFLGPFSFIASPISLLFNAFHLFKDIILRTTLIDMVRLFLLLFLPVLIVAFWLSFFFRKRYEPIPP